MDEVRYTISIAENGYVVEMSGRTADGKYSHTHYVFADREGVFEFLANSI